MKDIQKSSNSLIVAAATAFGLAAMGGLKFPEQEQEPQATEVVGRIRALQDGMKDTIEEHRESHANDYAKMLSRNHLYKEILGDITSVAQSTMLTDARAKEVYEEANRMSKEASDLETSTAEVDTRVKAMQGNIAELKSSLDELVKGNADVAAEIATLQAKINEFNAACNNHNDRAKKYQAIDRVVRNQLNARAEYRAQKERERQRNLQRQRGGPDERR